MSERLLVVESAGMREGQNRLTVAAFDRQCDIVDGDDDQTTG